MPINSPHPEYSTMEPKWKRCRDVSAGQDAVHTAGESYLPKLKDQSDADYKAMVMRSTFYNATWRTISGLIGMMLRVPPVIDVPETVKPLLDDVDAAGEPMQLFMQDICENALTVGRLGVLVDVPAITAQPGKPATMADAKAQNIRPTMQLYRAESIINWRTGRVNNKTVLTMVVLKECEWVPADAYSGKEEDRWRELTLENNVYRVRMWKRKAAPQGGQVPNLTDQFEQVGQDVFPVMNGKTMNLIPFVFLGTDDMTCDVDEPPLIDLVDVNLSHYRTTADYAHGCHFTGLPTLFLAGFKADEEADGTPKKVYIGSEAAIVSSNADAKASFVEFTGQGLTALKDKLDREEQQMAILGARMLEAQKKQAESADGSSIRRKGEESMLSSVAQALSLGMTQALKWFVMFTGTTAVDSVKAELNRDFYPARIAAPELTAMVSAWQLGAISDQTLFTNLQRGDIIAQDTTLEEEQERIADRQQQLMDQMGAGDTASADNLPDAGAKEIHIHIPKGSGKRTVTGPNNQKYVIEEDS